MGCSCGKEKTPKYQQIYESFNQKCKIKNINNYSQIKKI